MEQPGSSSGSESRPCGIAGPARRDPARNQFSDSPYHHFETIIGRVKTNIILIDFENVQPQDLTPLRGRPCKIKVFCGANQTKIPTGLVAALLPIGPDAELVLIQGSGRNALDFHIAYYIGRLSTEAPGGTFYIVTKDTGFDPLIKHLKTKDIACHRVPSLSDIPGLPSPSSASSSGRAQKVADHLLSRKDSRPRRRKTLQAFIKAQLGAPATDKEVSAVIERLTEGGMSILPDDRVTWPASV